MEIANILLIEGNYYEAFAELKEKLNNNTNLNTTAIENRKIDDKNTQNDSADTKENKNIKHNNVSIANAHQDLVKVSSSLKLQNNKVLLLSFVLK